MLTHQPNHQLSRVHHEKDLSEVANILAYMDVVLPLWMFFILVPIKTVEPLFLLFI